MQINIEPNQEYDLKLMCAQQKHLKAIGCIQADLDPLTHYKTVISSAIQERFNHE